MSDKPNAPACERNREPVLAVLREYFADRKRVLEIGSGTGQHAVYFAAAMPHLIWQTSDRAENLPGIRAWLDDAALPSTPAPIELDVSDAAWSLGRPPTAGEGRGGGRDYDAVFSANTLHIMAWNEVRSMFAQLPKAIAQDAKLVVYGPFNYNSAFTSDSNAAFDGWLKTQAPHMGIRDFEAADGLAHAIGFRLIDDIAMPANNRCLVWRRENPQPKNQ
ncbi:MAG: DUF938 domain-containing protein [Rhodanobacteraceae bacterium]